jgi:hypothetical protein
MSTPPVAPITVDKTPAVTTPVEKPRKFYRFHSYPMNFIFPSGRKVTCTQGTIRPETDEEEAYLDNAVLIGNLMVYDPEVDDAWVQSQTLGNVLNM